ncbi:mRNA decay activator protein zfp36 [Anaeramoeba flamelloides]|uniref:mRNA decay activator protein zfp36 n=1 Tax=Anaeramoeba flamelloides TaxID=1746091 RepID=A0ABQ8Y350_9EUKA|nr:mRNA decay activator protein zfp36 [Anaeramoeba flamelloides]
MNYQQNILLEQQPSLYFYNQDNFSPLRNPHHLQMSSQIIPESYESGRISPTHHTHNYSDNYSDNYSENYTETYNENYTQNYNHNHHHNHNHNHNHNHKHNLNRPKSPKHNNKTNSPQPTKNLKFKTEVCRNFFGEECMCEFGSRCNFIHYRDNPESIALGSIHALKLMGMYHHFSNRKKTSIKKKRLPIFKQLGNN